MTVGEILRVAREEIGVTESPRGTNSVKYNTEYYGKPVYSQSGDSYAWCVVFLWWVFRTAGASTLFKDGKKTASCANLMDYYRDRGQIVTGNYKPGDIVFFNFSGGSYPKHVGIVERVKDSNTVVTIEGNTSNTNNTNGDGVMRKERSLKDIICAGRPLYEGEYQSDVEETEEVTVTVELKMLSKGSKGEQVKVLQQILIANGYDCGKHGADGDFGSSTRAAVRDFQRGEGLIADGIVGKDTWSKLLGAN